MHKFYIKHRQIILKATLGSGILFILAIIGFFGRGVLRSDILPWYSHRYRIQTLQSTYRQEYSKLNNPFKQLGINLATSNTGECTLDIAIRWHTSIYCNLTNNTNSITLTDLALANYQVHTTEVEKSLTMNGWTYGGFDDAHIDKSNALNTIVRNDQSFTHNVAVYNKQIGNIYCQINLSTSSPDKQLSGDYSCNQTLYYFGNPYKAL